MTCAQLVHTRITYTTAEYQMVSAPFVEKPRLTAAEQHRFAHILCADDSEAVQQTHYLHYLCLAARRGYAAALYDWACFYQYGYNGLPQNQALAARLMQLAVRKAYPHAYYEQAVQALCRDGDVAGGRKWLLKAAAGRSQGAFWLLAEGHARGRWGFRRSQRLAVFYRKYAWRDDVLGL